MIGFSMNPSPPMGEETNSGNFGGVLQVVADDSRSMISQLLVYGFIPPQMSSLERP
jgi:hypothetical protein